MSLSVFDVRSSRGSVEEVLDFPEPLDVNSDIQMSLAMGTV